MLFARTEACQFTLCEDMVFEQLLSGLESDAVCGFEGGIQRVQGENIMMGS